MVGNTKHLVMTRVGGGIIAGIASMLLVFFVLQQWVHASGEMIQSPAALSTTVGTASPVSGISIGGSGNDTVSVELSVGSGSLAFGSSTGLTFSPNGTTTGTSLHIQGTRSNVNAALATLTYNGSSAGSTELRLALVNYGEVLYPQNRHLYEYVSTPGGMTWSDARDAAAQRVKYGASGYLATITSSTEDSYVYARLLGVGWIGASDLGHEGDWRWVVGPEAGTQFWSGSTYGSPVGSSYVSWDTNQPDNANWYPGSTDENCAQIGMIATMTTKWNDMPCIYPMPGYVVEYGAPGNMPNIPEKSITLYTTALGTPVDDGDGISAATENSGPASGDANNDGTLDSLQPNVVNFTSTVNGQPIALEVPSTCTLSQVSAQPLSANGVADGSYTYPAGLLDFTATCTGTPGQNITVSQYFYGVSPTDLVLRKYNPTTHAYATVTGATLASATVGGLSATRATYQITDGGDLDADGIANGTIVDPVGLAQSPLVPGTPNTGFERQHTNSVLLFGVGGLVVVVVTVLVYARRYTRG